MVFLVVRVEVGSCFLLRPRAQRRLSPVPPMMLEPLLTLRRCSRAACDRCIVLHAHAVAIIVIGQRVAPPTAMTRRWLLLLQRRKVNFNFSSALDTLLPQWRIVNFNYSSALDTVFSVFHQHRIPDRLRT